VVEMMEEEEGRKEEGRKGEGGGGLDRLAGRALRVQTGEGGGREGGRKGGRI